VGWADKPGIDVARNAGRLGWQAQHRRSSSSGWACQPSLRRSARSVRPVILSARAVA